MRGRSKKCREKRMRKIRHFDLELGTKAENNPELKLKIEEIERGIFEEIKRMIEIYDSKS